MRPRRKKTIRQPTFFMHNSQQIYSHPVPALPSDVRRRLCPAVSLLLDVGLRPRFKLSNCKSRTGSDSDLVAWNATHCFCPPDGFVTFHAIRSLSLPVLLPSR